MISCYCRCRRGRRAAATAVSTATHQNFVMPNVCFPCALPDGPRNAICLCCGHVCACICSMGEILYRKGYVRTEKGPPAFSDMLFSEHGTSLSILCTDTPYHPTPHILHTTFTHTKYTYMLYIIIQIAICCW